MHSFYCGKRVGRRCNHDAVSISRPRIHEKSFEIRPLNSLEYYTWFVFGKSAYVARLDKLARRLSDGGPVRLRVFDQ